MNPKTKESLLSREAEEFFLTVQVGARHEQRPNVVTNSESIDPEYVARVTQHAMLWLTPRIVEPYRESAFQGWPEGLQNKLREAVESFREVASQVPGNAPPTREQASNGTQAFARLKEAVREVILWEWLPACNDLIDRVESWAQGFGWETRRPREPKLMEELLLGKYELEQLYVYAEGNLHVLDPVARLVHGGLGSFDLSIQPSFEMTSIYRSLDAVWRIRLGVGRGARRTTDKLSSTTLRRAIEELRSLV